MPNASFPAPSAPVTNGRMGRGISVKNKCRTAPRCARASDTLTSPETGGRPLPAMRQAGRYKVKAAGAGLNRNYLAAVADTKASN
jgi:hypothetical protein